MADFVRKSTGFKCFRVKFRESELKEESIPLIYTNFRFIERVTCWPNNVFIFVPETKRYIMQLTLINTTGTLRIVHNSRIMATANTLRVVHKKIDRPVIKLITS